VKEKKPAFFLILTSLVLTPLFSIAVVSVYRASRLMVFIPLMAFIFTLGIKAVLEIRNRFFKLFLLAFFILALVGNYLDFTNYYLDAYPKAIAQEFSPNYDLSFKKLKELTDNKGKSPYIEETAFLRQYRAGWQFFKEVYFPKSDFRIWDRAEEQFPESGLVLTDIKGTEEVINYAEIESLQSGQKSLFIVGKSD